MSSKKIKRDFIFVDDIADANVSAMNSSVSSGFFNIGTGIPTTILELADIKTEFDVSGESFCDYLKNTDKKLENKKYAYSETGALQGPFPSPEEPNVFCIKSSRHKLIYYKASEKWELYDLKNDPSETNNIFNTGLDVEQELKEKLLSWINR